MKKVAAGSVRRLSVAAGLLAVLFVVWGAGCRKEAPQPDANTPAGGTAVETPKGEEARADKVMATVNGVEILESQVKQQVKANWGPQLQKMVAESPQMAAQWEQTARQMALNQLVIGQLIEEQANLAGVSITEEQVMAEMTRQLANQDPPLTLEQYQKMTDAQGIGFETMKESFSRQMKYDRFLHRFLQGEVAGKITVSEEDAKDYYDKHPDEFKVPEQVRASHILVSTRPTDASADPNQVKAQARAKAEGLLKQVKEGGDFAALAKESSADHYSAVQGGELPLFGRGDMVPPFEEAAFALKPGEISDLVETQFGYHIIKVSEHRDPNQVTFEAAKDEIMAEMKTTKMQKAIEDYVASLRQKAQITYPTGDTTPTAPAATDARSVRPERQPAVTPERPVPTAPTGGADKG